MKKMFVECELSNLQFEHQCLHLTLHTTLRALCRKAEKLIFGCNCELLRNNYSIIKWHHLVNIREALHIKCMSMKIRDGLISAVFSATLECVQLLLIERNHSAQTQPPLHLAKPFE